MPDVQFYLAAVAVSQVVVIALLTALLLKRKTAGAATVISHEGFEVAQEGIVMDFTITVGGMKNIQFKPLNKFGEPSDWDGAPVQQIITGPATIEGPVTTFTDGSPVPADEQNEWFLLKSNGTAGATTAEYIGDGHTEAEGEEESIKPIPFTVNITAVTADAESVTSSERLEVPQV